MSGEALLWDWLKDVLPLGQYSRIESHDTAPGFPDVDGQIKFRKKSQSFKLELKFCHHPNRYLPFNKRDGIRKSQKIWWKNYVRCGGVGWIVAEVGDSVFVIPGRNTPQINNASKEDLLEWSDCILDRKDMKQSNVLLTQLLKQGTL